MAEGFFDIREIPEGRLSSAIQERVRRVTKSGKPEIDPAVVAVLRQFPYPRYYLDFETIAFAVPTWAGTRPYQPIPFQWSCHIEHADDKLDHKWFLDTSGKPPLKELRKVLSMSWGTQAQFSCTALTRRGSSTI